MAYLIKTRQFKQIREIFAKTDVFINYDALVLEALRREEAQNTFFTEFPELYDTDYLHALARNYRNYANQLLSHCTGKGSEMCLSNLPEITESIQTFSEKMDFLWKLMIVENSGDNYNPRLFSKRITLCAYQLTSIYENSDNDIKYTFNLIFNLRNAPKEVLERLFTEAVQMGSIDLVDVIYSTKLFSVNDKFYNGVISGNALIFVTNNALMLKKLFDFEANLGALVQFPKCKVMTVVTWLLLQNNQEMNELIYALELPNFLFDIFLGESYDYHLPLLQDYVLTRDPTRSHLLKLMKSKQPPPIETFYFLESTKGDEELLLRLQELLCQQRITTTSSDREIYLNAIIAQDLYIIKQAREMEVPLVIDNVLKSHLIQVLHAKGTESFIQFFQADPRLLEFNFMKYLLRDTNVYAKIFLIAPKTCTSHLMWLESVWKNKKKYLEFLYLIMQEYAVEEIDEVVNAISREYVATLKRLNVNRAPRKIFSVQTAFKRAIILIAESAGLDALHRALIEHLTPRIEQVNQCAFTFRSIRNYLQRSLQ